MPVHPDSVPVYPSIDGGGGRLPLLFTLPFVFNATASIYNNATIYAENIVPIVSANETIIIGTTVNELKSVFTFVVANNVPIPTLATFNPTALGYTISGWASVPTITDDTGNTVTTPFGVLSNFAQNAGSLTLPLDLNCIQSYKNTGARIDDLFKNTYLQASNFQGAWDNVSGGQAMFALFEQLAGNGRVGNSNKNSTDSPTYYIGDALQFFVNYAVNINIGYQWSTDFANGNFSDVNSNQFALTDFNQDDFTTGVVFTVCGENYTLSNTHVSSNYIYRVELISVS